MENIGYNLTATVAIAVNNTFMQSISQKMMLSNDPGRFVLHPMYVMLQEQSPMGMLRNFELREVDSQ